MLKGKVPARVFLSLMLFNAMMAFFFSAWLHALSVNGGEIRWHVNALAEGWVELALFAVLLAVGTSAAAWVITTRDESSARREP